MTIKEVEEKTGMSRTNIRFYEREGLIQPRRQENGYREYSAEDARMLMKVRLLRSMDIPLDQVKAMAFGERKLSDVLAKLNTELDRRQSCQERTRQAISQMNQEGAAFEDLEPERYLTMLETGKPVEDAPPRLNLPWRRYWARSVDFCLYCVLVTILTDGFRHQIILLPILTRLAMLAVEPLLLSLFATTPGKAIFGIRVTDHEGLRLDYSTAIERTWMVLWEGEALRIPLVRLYFQYKGLRFAEQEIRLSWEEDSVLTYSDGKNWRYALLLAAYAMLLGAEFWISGG